MNRLLLLLLFAVLVGCAAESSKEDTASSSESAALTARTESRRARIERLSRVNALARLYVGHELSREELAALATKSEAEIIDSLAQRTDFSERFAARVAEYRALESRSAVGGASSPALNVDAPLLAAFDGEKKDASAFARFVLQTQAPAIASETALAKQDASTMTYRELLDAIRVASLGKRS